MLSPCFRGDIRFGGGVGATISSVMARQLGQVRLGITSPVWCLILATFSNLEHPDTIPSTPGNLASMGCYSLGSGGEPWQGLKAVWQGMQRIS